MGIDQNSRDRVIKLIQKLKEVRFDRGATPAEEARAVDKIRQLLEQHQLSMFDVAAKKFNDKMVEERVGISGQILHAWYNTLAAAVANAFDCQVVLIPEGQWGAGSKTWHLSFLGYTTDVKMAVYFFNYLKVRLNDMADIDGRSRGRRGSQLFAFRKHYIRAAALEVGQRLKAERDERLQDNVDCRAMIAVKAPAVADFVKETFPTLRKSKASEWKDHEAMAAGREAGRNVELRRGIESDSVGEVQRSVVSLPG